MGTDREQTLCWKCKKTNWMDCSWFDPDDPQPVEGWVAVKDEDRRDIGTSYTVIKCPNFEPEEERKQEEAFPGVFWDAEAMMWCAYIVRIGVRYELGQYRTVEGALGARRKAEREWRECPWEDLV
jgi:hypothetical protein